MMKEIEVGKKYTFDGYLGIIRYTDGKEPKYPVLWKDLGTGATYHFSIKGYWRGDDKTRLIEVSPYFDIPIDTPVWARHEKTDKWISGHFAGVINGRPTTWIGGGTNHTKLYRDSWAEVKTVNPNSWD